MRLADFNNAKGHPLSLLLPVGAGLVYLRRISDDREIEIPAAPEEIRLAELTQREPRVTTRGAAHDAFSLIFSLPFDDAALAAYTVADDGPDGQGDRSLSWRTIAGRGALVVAGVSAVAGALLMYSAQSLASQAQAAPTQAMTAELNARLSARNQQMAVAYGAGVLAAISGGVLLLGSDDHPFQPYGAVGGGIAGMFVRSAQVGTQGGQRAGLADAIPVVGR